MGHRDLPEVIRQPWIALETANNHMGNYWTTRMRLLLLTLGIALIIIFSPALAGPGRQLADRSAAQRRPF